MLQKEKSRQAHATAAISFKRKLDLNKLHLDRCTDVDKAEPDLCSQPNLADYTSVPNPDVINFDFTRLEIATEFQIPLTLTSENPFRVTNSTILVSRYQVFFVGEIGRPYASGPVF